MTKTQYYTATSIDGFIADENNSLDWLFESGSKEATSRDSRERFDTFFADVGAMAMGATTYEWVLDHDQLLDNPDAWRGYYGETPCWVFTHRRLPPVPGMDIRFVHGDVRAVHDQMASAAHGRNVWLVGGGDLAGQFADHGLLDEMLLAVAPVVLGSGAPLLPRRLTAPQLALRSVEQDGGFAFLTYQVTRTFQA